MSGNSERDQMDRGQKAHVHRSPADFQEAPGEPEAEAVRKAFLQRTGPGPETVSSALDRADTATRAQDVNRLQAERGNQFVQRVVSAAPGTPGRQVGLSQNEMVSEVLQRKGMGGPLAQPAREQLEDHFGVDLGAVHVHADGEAAALSRELNADAFTVGNDIFLAEGKYQPSSTEGQGLLAHELAHVSQQTGLNQNGVQRQAEAEQEEELVQRQAGAEQEEELDQS